MFSFVHIFSFSLETLAKNVNIREAIDINRKDFTLGSFIITVWVLLRTIRMKGAIIKFLRYHEFEETLVENDWNFSVVFIGCGALFWMILQNSHKRQISN